MWHESARIDSPEVIKDFRIAFIKFVQTAKQACTGIQSDCQRSRQPTSDSLRSRTPDRSGHR